MRGGGAGDGRFGAGRLTGGGCGMGLGPGRVGGGGGGGAVSFTGGGLLKPPPGIGSSVGPVGWR